jgi:carboxylesterase type B
LHIVGTQWSPVVDGVVLPAAPAAMLRAGKAAAGVPVLLGSNRDEGSTFISVRPARLPRDVSLNTTHSTPY